MVTMARRVRSASRGAFDTIARLNGDRLKTTRRLASVEVTLAVKPARSTISLNRRRPYGTSVLTVLTSQWPCGASPTSVGRPEMVGHRWRLRLVWPLEEASCDRFLDRGCAFLQDRQGVVVTSSTWKNAGGPNRAIQRAGKCRR